jgi:hypothetical protein
MTRDVICDFCSTKGPTWKYNARDFVTDVRYQDGRPWASFSSWLACDACKALIEANKWDRLRKRTIDTLIRRRQLRLSRREREGLDEQLRGLHQNFRASRQGDVVPLSVLEVEALSKGPENFTTEVD